MIDVNELIEAGVPVELAHLYVHQYPGCWYELITSDPTYCDHHAEMLPGVSSDGTCRYIIALEPMTRDEAIAAGLTKYWTGKPCRNGHIALRYVNGRACVECRRMRYETDAGVRVSFRVRTVMDRERLITLAREEGLLI